MVGKGKPLRETRGSAGRVRRCGSSDDELTQSARMTSVWYRASDAAPGEFVHTLGDAHLYLNHVDQAREQLERQPYPFPTLQIADKRDLFAFEYEDFKLEGYQAHPSIAAPIAV